MKEMSEIRLINLKKILDKYETQQDLAEALDLPPARINHLLRGVRNIGEKTARQIEAKLDLPRGWMDILRDADIGINAYSSLPNPTHDINFTEGPLIKGEVPLISFVQAGEWCEAIDNYQPGSGERMVSVTVPVGRHTFALRVAGDSMEPEFVEGDVIIVEPDLDADHKDFVIAKNGGDATFKQLIKDGSEWHLKPLNDRYPIKPLGNSIIIGVVREKTKVYR